MPMRFRKEIQKMPRAMSMGPDGILAPAASASYEEHHKANHG